MIRRVAIALGLLALLAGPDALATRFRRPYWPDRGLTAGFDDRRGTGMRDYGCGQNTYEDHTGTDFGVYFTDVLAMAPATVTQTNQGCADYGGLGNTCGGRCGNYVRMRFDDGTEGLYCHMKNGSIAVHPGQRVNCGDRIGTSASSGNSTGPHLHVTWLVGGALRDLYAGPCSNSGGAWVQQRGYLQAPGTDCEVNCECSPGQVQRQGCGRCGVQQRVCNGGCHWDGWSGCGGEGPCWPGQAEEQACCDCGRQRRTCNGACQWDGWSECAGPDPAGAPSCSTGKLGVCAEGKTRCVRGCLACVQLREPSPEACDDLDNDCDGPVDEDAPKQLGSPPPAFAATVVDASFPRWMPSGTTGEAWIAFKNVGTATWRAREVSLRSDAPAQGKQSLLAPAVGWAAFDTAAVLDRDVSPGETAVLRFPVSPRRADADIDETFSLVAPSGRAVACPEGSLDLAIATVGYAVSDAPDAGTAAPASAAEESCANVPADVTGFVLGLAALLARRRRR